jgi:hypothetical protein
MVLKKLQLIKIYFDLDEMPITNVSGASRGVILSVGSNPTHLIFRSDGSNEDGLIQ